MQFISTSQMFNFVRRISCDAAKEYLKTLKKEEVPVIVCLTHADRLYVEYIDESSDKDPTPTEDRKRRIGLELQVLIVHLSRTCVIKYIFLAPPSCY